MTSKPDFAAMTLKQQLEAYNELSDTKRKSVFKNREQGALALEIAWREKHPPVLSEKTPLPKMPKIDPASVPGAATGRASGKTATSEEVKKVRGLAAKKVKILVDRNPRRQNTGGHEYFAALQKSATVADYFAQFGTDETKLRDARIWLYYNRRDRFVELVD